MYGSPKSRAMLLMAACALLLAGCQSPHESEPYVLGSPALMFDRQPMAFDSTQFARSEWPMAALGVESIDRQTTVEYYRDYFGNAAQERTTPQRYTYGFRTVTRVR